MIRTRRLEIVGDKKMKGLYMKVAFASTDKIHIDEHFGKAEEFYIWNIGPEEAEFSGVVQVTEDGDAADRIEARGAALEECALVYVGATRPLPQAETEQKRYSLFALGAGVLVAAVIIMSKT